MSEKVEHSYKKEDS